MKLLLHLLMLAFLSGGSAKVVQNFEQSCGQFFANNRSPTQFEGTHYRQICQTLNAVSHYATYYDTKNKIPVYSAYIFNGINNNERTDCWNIEPQLTNNNFGPDMAMLSDTAHGVSQAIKRDYKQSDKQSDYDRGHLFPVSHASSQECADATFTLTNAAPQNRAFNRGQWKVLEDKIAADLNRECKSYTAFIVTGVVPGESKLFNRVNVPSHFWTSYCCLDNSKRCQNSKGYLGSNRNIFPKELDVNNLQNELASLYNVKSFVLFHS